MARTGSEVVQEYPYKGLGEHVELLIKIVSSREGLVESGDELVKEEDKKAFAWISGQVPLMIDMIYAVVTSNINRREWRHNLINVFIYQLYQLIAGVYLLCFWAATATGTSSRSIPYGTTTD